MSRAHDPKALREQVAAQAWPEQVGAPELA